MKERPILFSGPMVRAILAGTKTQTRRICREWEPSGTGADFDQERLARRCPQGKPGDRLWVRETWQRFDPDRDGIPPERFDGSAPFTGSSGGENPGPVHWRACYAADGPLVHPEHGPARWKPSIHMPRWASRITLDVVSVRVERLQAITEDDARAEGARPFFETFANIGRDQRLTTGELAADAEYRAGFACLWDDLYGDSASWASNPWVWVIGLARVKP